MDKDFMEKATMKEYLTTLQKGNKLVNIYLCAGISFNGTIQKIGTNLVVLKLGGGKSFFDATILLEDIVAVEVQVRT